jgi:hypothetical protein
MNRFTVALALAVATMLTPVFAAPASAATQLPAVGTVVGGGSFTGTFTISRFASRGGQLVAVGTLTGTLTNAAGVVTSILDTITIPVTNVTGSCDILHLEIGPISLDLLGLQVDLSKIVLDIDAQSGAGNLLGNLLCGVVNLLNDPTGLAKLLNQILALL